MVALLASGAWAGHSWQSPDASSQYGCHDDDSVQLLPPGQFDDLAEPCSFPHSTCATSPSICFKIRSSFATCGPPSKAALASRIPTCAALLSTALYRCCWSSFHTDNDTLSLSPSLFLSLSLPLLLRRSISLLWGWCSYAVMAEHVTTVTTIYGTKQLPAGCSALRACVSAAEKGFRSSVSP